MGETKGQDQEFTVLWEEALASYCKSTNRNSIQQINSVDELITQLEQRQKDFQDYRSRYSKLLSSMKHCLQPVVLVSNITQSAVGATPFAPAATLIGAFVYLFQAANGVSEAYDWIQSLLQELSAFTERLEVYLSEQVDHRLQRQLVTTLSCLLEIVGTAESTVASGRFKKFGAVLLNGKDEIAKAAFDRLNKIFQNESRLVQALSYKATQSIQNQMNLITTSLDSSHTLKNTEAEGSLIKEFLKTPSYTTILQTYEEYNESTVHDSGKWLLQESQYTSWLNQRSSAKPLLFVTGPPGTGKSFLSTFTVSRLKEKYTSVAYFYVKVGDSASQDLLTILKTVAYQLAINDIGFRKNTLDVLGKENYLLTPSTIWNNLFLEHYSVSVDEKAGRFNPSMVVIDGLDEAPSSTVRGLIALLHTLPTQPKPSKLFIALFGRPEIVQYISGGLKLLVETIDITQKNNDDIRLYSTQEVKKMTLIRLKRVQESPKAAADIARQIRDAVVANADGMFFKAVLIFKQIMEKSRFFSILDAIKSSPPGLDDMICNVFERILDDPAIERDDLRELLIWASFAKRPPRLSELYTLFEHRDGHPYELLESHLRGKLASVFKVLGSAVPTLEVAEAVVEEAGKTEDIDDFDIDKLGIEDTEADSGPSISPKRANGLTKRLIRRYHNTTIQFTHASVRDFVTLVPDEDGKSERLAISLCEAESQWHLAVTCLNCIIDFNISRDWTAPQYRSHCRLVDYAVRHWSDHLLSVNLRNLNDNQRAQLSIKICQVFGGGAGTLSFLDASYFDYNKTLHIIVATTTVFDQMRRLLDSIGEKSSSLDLTHSQKRWLQNESGSREQFFQPLQKSAHQRLMSRTAHDDMAYQDERYFLYYAYIIHSLTQLAENPSTASVSAGGLSECRPPSFDPVILRKICELEDLPRTQHWYTCYGMVMEKANETEDAIEMYKQAVNADQQSWRAYKGLGVCNLKRQNLVAAETAFRTALPLTEAISEQEHIKTSCDIIHVKLERGQHQQARSEALELHNQWPTNRDVTQLYIQCLFLLRDFVTIADLAEKRITAIEGFWGLHLVQKEVALALRHTKRTKSILRWIPPGCIKEKRASKQPWLSVWLAHFRCDSAEDRSIAIDEFEAFLTPKFQASVNPELQWSLNYPLNSAWKQLTAIYLDKAIEEGQQEGGNAQKWVNRLRGFVDTRVTLYGVPQPAMALGYYAREIEKADESVWKPQFSNYITSILQKLDHGEYTRLWNLAHALALAGDNEGAITAVAPCLLHWELQDSPELKKLEELNIPRHFLCDGYCSGWVNTYKHAPYENLWICATCLSSTFCGDCYRQLKHNGISTDCSPNHTHIQAFPIPESSKSVAMEFTYGEDGEVGLRLRPEWITQLRERWAET